MSDKITVSINGVLITIETDINPIEMHAIAKFVEEKIQEVQSNSNETSTSKIITLACLNIASEYFRLKNSRENEINVINRKFAELQAVIDTGPEN